MLFKLSPLTIKWLPVSNSNRTDLTLLKEVLRSIGTPNAFLWFVDQARFGYVNRKKGLISLLSPMHAHEVHGRQRRYRPPKPPAIKGVLQTAVCLQHQLDSSPSLTRLALAKRLKLDPSRITQILNLLNLAPKIQDYIRNLPPIKHRHFISDRDWMRLARIQNQELQLREFDRLQPSSLGVRHKSCR